MSEHTPGPWVLREYDGGFHVQSPDGLHIAGISNGFFDDEAKESVANARLIAAAPDLLTALAHICEMQARNYGDGVSTHMELIGLAERAGAAIAKATGSEVAP